ncbi:MAG: exodeoxyribonuclease VII large subunit [Bacteroidetes bacterium HGW-Bacteroidetes-1]|jgi:exodeoxyribonuclease VII large subunit|nr:MAG: exodeoxyribonuclease VII large subunit [Bacteroidetes bacterium HGW-Bacteroidetes-1]
MPENINNRQIFTLKEVALSIQNTIANRYKATFWVKAEMNKLNHYPHSGHCYPDLLYKEDGKITAQMKSIIWKMDFYQIGQRFKKITGENLHDGINILFLGSLIFDPNHGLTIRIHDIDPSFTLGELEREKNAAILRLNDEGIFNRNRSLPFPLLPKRVAIISVESSKGFADFVKLTESRMSGFKIEYHLFPSLLQGDKSVELMIRQLEKIKKIARHFDVVAIIRGGGGEVGLSSFNNYHLAKTIALFPIPIITGIGHATNLTVSEMVAHTNAITPSQLADLLLERFEYFIHMLRNAAKSIKQTQGTLLNEQQQLSHYNYQIKHLIQRLFEYENRRQADLHNIIRYSMMEYFNLSKSNVSTLANKMQRASNEMLSEKNKNLELAVYQIKNSSSQWLQKSKSILLAQEKTVELLHPVNVLKRGYSITYKHGKVLKDQSSLHHGDEVETLLSNGRFSSTITKVESKEKN